LVVFIFVFRIRTGKGSGKREFSPACRQAGVVEALKPQGVRERSDVRFLWGHNNEKTGSARFFCFYVIAERMMTLPIASTIPKYWWD
jgi:hypothetical protein